MYAIQKLVTRFEQGGVWTKQNNCRYSKKEALAELKSLNHSYRDINFRIVKAE